MRFAIFNFLAAPACLWMRVMAFLLNVEFRDSLEEVDEEEFYKEE